MTGVESLTVLSFIANIMQLVDFTDKLFLYSLAYLAIRPRLGMASEQVRGIFFLHNHKIYLVVVYVRGNICS